MEGEPEPETAAAVPEVNAADGDTFTDYQTLTPELVEEEAQRGDFVLQWAVVLLAILFGCTPIAETATLVHLRTGQYLSQHGFIPPAHDVFSYTASDRRWTNLAWGFDLASAGAYMVTGAVGLSLLKALIVGLIFYCVVDAAYPHISTWWTAVAGALALLACQPQLTVEPKLVTLLGAAILLWLLTSWSEGWLPRRGVWGVVPLLWVWSNFDERAYIGIGLLLLFAVGQSISIRQGRHAAGVGLAEPIGVASLHDLGALPGVQALTRGSDDQRTTMRELWLPVLLACVAWCVHPFGWKVWTGPLLTLAGEYPAHREFALGLDPATGWWGVWKAAWQTPGWSLVGAPGWGGLLLLLSAGVLLFLNRARLRWEHVLWTVAAYALALFGVHDQSLSSVESGVAALICAVVAGLNGQIWYQANFRQTYSIESGELLFSRGGRALTVFLFLLMAYFAFSGRLNGPRPTVTGLGFDYGLSQNLRSLEAAVEDSLDNRPFNFGATQGDMLIWLGQQVFVDTRLGFYQRSAPEVLRAHGALRESLRQEATGLSAVGETARWKTDCNRHQISHVLPRLSSVQPDYRAWLALMSAPDAWRLTHLGAATAVIYRTDLPEAKDYVESHAVDFNRLAFKTDAGELPPRLAFPSEPSVYDRYLLPRQRRIPNAVHEATHLGLLASSGNMASQRVALTYLAIRRAQTGLAENVRCVEGYMALGRAYSLLLPIDGELLVPSFGWERSSLRFYQSVAAYRQALVIEPRNESALSALYELFEAFQHWDLAAQVLREIDDILIRLEKVDPGNEQLRERTQSVYAALSQLDRAQAKVDEGLKRAAGQGANAVNLAMLAARQGCHLRALDVLEENADQLQGNLEAQLMACVLLLEAGRVTAAADRIDQLALPCQQRGVWAWYPAAALVRWSLGDYAGVEQIWSDFASGLQTTEMNRLISAALPQAASSHELPWPLTALRVAFNYEETVDSAASSTETILGLARVEAGRPKAAIEAFKASLKVNPDTPYRGIVRFYLDRLTGETIDWLPPSERVPVEFEPEEEKLSGTRQ